MKHLAWMVCELVSYLIAVFLDIQPINQGHVLVVPVIHTQGLEDLEPEDGKHLFKITQ